MEQNNQLVKGIRKIEQCRICQNKNLKHILTLGNQYLVDFLDNKEDTNYVAPLELVLCSKRTMAVVYYNYNILFPQIYYIENFGTKVE